MSQPEREKQVNSNLKKAISEYLAQHKKLAQYQKKHNDVFLHARELDRARAAAEKKLKELAVGEAIPGETVVIEDNAQIKLQAIGGHSSPTYNPIQLSKLVSPELFAQMVSIDSSKAEALVTLGKISPEHLKTAQNPRAPISPRIKIEVK